MNRKKTVLVAAGICIALLGLAFVNNNLEKIRKNHMKETQKIVIQVKLYLKLMIRLIANQQPKNLKRYLSFQEMLGITMKKRIGRILREIIYLIVTE